MKRKIFLSFRPEYFRPILYNIKKYEYRKRFCKEPITAFLYLSAPVQEVIGIVELGMPIDLILIKDKYKNKDKCIYERINKTIDGREVFAIPIESLQLFKEPVSINQIKKIDNDFHVPQCYLNIEKYNEVYNFLCDRELYEKEFLNQHKEIYENNFCVSCSEMECTEEFISKDKEFKNNKKYNIIKSGYLNKRKNDNKNIYSFLK